MMMMMMIVRPNIPQYRLTYLNVECRHLGIKLAIRYEEP